MGWKIIPNEFVMKGNVKMFFQNASLPIEKSISLLFSKVLTEDGFINFGLELGKLITIILDEASTSEDRKK